MANAKKCDRCATFYMQPVNRRVADIHENSIEKEYDLCSRCLDLFENFINNEPILSEENEKPQIMWKKEG